MQVVRVGISRDLFV